jgi:hypothetical protein
MSDSAIRWLRYILPALIGTVAGVLLEAYVWRGRGAGAIGGTS